MPNESEGITLMTAKASDSWRGPVVEANGEGADGAPPGCLRPAQKGPSAEEIRLPPGASERPGSKVTWQGFVDWMTARGF